jgi:superfamily II DNA or RNA helicase
VSDISRVVPPLRIHQQRALDALDRAWSTGRSRAWVVLPPGAGKTRVGIETIQGHLATGVVTHAVVLSPNTAIQAQWTAAGGVHGLEVDETRDLEREVTSLTYQSLAVFDADDEVADDPEDLPAVLPVAAPPEPSGTPTGGLLDRLHPRGRALVERMREEEGLLLVLDECHHLLEVWGRLLGELLDELPRARVLGLTATPPETLRPDQARLVDDLFGEIAFEAGVPSVVREGHLAPFAELAWLTTPTVAEEEWLAEEATRFAELTTRLTDPAFGSVPFLEWVDRRFVLPVPGVLTWATMTRQEPSLARAVLRLHHAGLVALPHGARPGEEHRRAPSAEDWMELVEDWLLRQVSRSADERDAEVVAVVRRALPAVGYSWTRNGVRRGRSAVDRVLARSQSKTTACVDIVACELGVLGPRLRMLVLCDHERASAMLPSGLDGVLDQQSGSAVAALQALTDDPTTRTLSPVMVTGSTVAGERDTLLALVEQVAGTAPELAARLDVVPLEGTSLSHVVGPWTSRRWVRHVTRFFEDGRCQVLVGTRGLLGEGWDARRVTGLVDLTTATTLTAVVQTRGRALRTDPDWPDKVAVNWSVVCVSDEHPKGGNDWDRLVRKHQGFHGVDEDGDVVDGVAHLDSGFSAFAPPATSAFAEINGRMRERCSRRGEIAARWRVGEPYNDLVVATLRITGGAGRAPAVAAGRAVRLPAPVPARVVQLAAGLDLRGVHPAPERAGMAGPGPYVMGAAFAGWGAAMVPVALAAPDTGAQLSFAVFMGVMSAAGLTIHGLSRRERGRGLNAWARDLLGEASSSPSVHAVACAVAQGLHDAGLIAAGSDEVVVEVHEGAELRCRVAGASLADSQTFTTALDEVLAPMSTPRYVVARHVGSVPDSPVGRAHKLAQAMARLRARAATGVVWHSVPSVLGVNATRAGHFSRAWDRWVGGAELLYTGSPEGAGVLAAQQGADPFAVTTVVRRHWT